jgi:hypothetical protein
MLDTEQDEMRDAVEAWACRLLAYEQPTVLEL